MLVGGGGGRLGGRGSVAGEARVCVFLRVCAPRCEPVQSASVRNSALAYTSAFCAVAFATA
eukprot:3649132-Pleurochrysis_carterae.AAC.1